MVGFQSKRQAAYTRIAEELIDISPFPVSAEHYPTGFKIKLQTTLRANTRFPDKDRTSGWLSITPDQFKKIEQVLLDEI